MSMKQNDETKAIWGMVNKDYFVMLCADQADAEQEAKNAQDVWPHMGPHRAVQLVEVGDAGFTAADMATAEARGFRDGQAAELAAMRTGGEPVMWAFQYSDGSWHHGSGTEHSAGMKPLYTHPQPAAQDADPLQGAANWLAWLAQAHGQFCVAVLQDRLMIGYNRAKRLHDAAIAAQQGDSHEPE